MAVTLAALLVVFWNSERPGQRVTAIESLVFSPDGSKLAVLAATIRRNKPLRTMTIPDEDEYSDPSRAIFTINTEAGFLERASLRETRKEDFGMRPFFRSEPLAIDPQSQKIAAISFVDDHVVFLDVEGDKSKKVVLDHPVESIAFSGTGKWFGCFGAELVSVFNTRTHQPVFRTKASGGIFADTGSIYPYGYFDDGTKVVFSIDEKRVLLTYASVLMSWDIANPLAPATDHSFDSSSLSNIAHVEIAPDGSRVLCGSEGVVVVDKHGAMQKRITDLLYAFGFSFSDDCSRLVFLKRREVAAYTFDGDFERVQLKHAMKGSCVKISPNGKWIAQVENAKEIALHDFETGKQVWKVALPERGYVTWPYPAACIGLWCMVATVFYVRSKRKRTPRWTDE